MIMVHVDEATMARLRKAADETGRSIEQLASDGVAEYMLNGFRGRQDDPGKETQR